MTEMPSFIPFQGIYPLEWAVFALKQLHCVKYCLKYDHFSITVMDISGSEMCHHHLFLVCNAASEIRIPMEGHKNIKY